MPWQDSDTKGGRVSLKHSGTAGETITGSGLVPGELALNSADGRLFYSGGSFPSATGINKIVAITQAAYDALAVKDSATLYVIT